MSLSITIHELVPSIGLQAELFDAPRQSDMRERAKAVITSRALDKSTIALGATLYPSACYYP